MFVTAALKVFVTEALKFVSAALKFVTAALSVCN